MTWPPPSFEADAHKLPVRRGVAPSTACDCLCAMLTSSLRGVGVQEPASDWVRMPGFPGVFVGVMVRAATRGAPPHARRSVSHGTVAVMIANQNDATGKVVDRRPTKGRPSYAELAERPASELKEMWIKVRVLHASRERMVAR